MRINGNANTTSSVAKWIRYYTDLKIRLHTVVSGRDAFNDIDIVKAKSFTFAHLANDSQISELFNDGEQKVIADAIGIFTALESSRFEQNAIEAIVAPYDEATLFTAFDAVLARVPGERTIRRRVC